MALPKHWCTTFDRNKKKVNFWDTIPWTLNAPGISFESNSDMNNSKNSNQNWQFHNDLIQTPNLSSYDGQPIKTVPLPYYGGPPETIPLPHHGKRINKTPAIYHKKNIINSTLPFDGRPVINSTLPFDGRPVINSTLSCDGRPVINATLPYYL